MSDHRIIKVELDEATILRRNADIEQERRVAIFDLIEDNVFKPLRDFGDGYAGPYHLKISVEEGRLILDIRRSDDTAFEVLILGLGRFRRIVKDYFAICDSYYQAIRKASAAEIETIDMARRGVHNEAAELLMERLEGTTRSSGSCDRRARGDARPMVGAARAHAGQHRHRPGRP